MNDALTPLHAFRFLLRFSRSGGEGGQEDVCGGAFAECSGLESSMEPKLIRAGGMNYGAVQRAGPVSFATVVLKRGMTRTPDLFRWYQLVAGGAYAWRLSAELVVLDTAGDTALTWGLDHCLPVKFKAADLNARGGEIGIEELHLVHQGLRLFDPGSA
jgi:phage tail-like protein